MANTQFAVKIRMKHTGSYSVGPYASMDEAKNTAMLITSGELDGVQTQRGTILYLCDDPEVVEIVPFTPRFRDDKEDE